MADPLISVLLPTYNGKEEWISEAIDSVLNQTYWNFELIILNDASTNEVEKTILSYSKKDRRIKYTKNPCNLQLTKTLNKGIKQSKGKYLARIDDDDIRYDTQKLEKQVKFMEANSEYGLCGTNVITINEQGEKLNTIHMREDDNNIKAHLLQSNQFAHTSVMIRKQVLDQVGGAYNPKYNLAEDYELWCKVGTISKFYNLQNSEIKYRMNTKSVSRKNYFKQKRLSFKTFWKYKRYYPNSMRAFFLRIGDGIMPEQWSQFILQTLNKCKPKQ